MGYYDPIRDEYYTDTDLRDFEMRARPWWQLIAVKPDGTEIVCEGHSTNVGRTVKFMRTLQALADTDGNRLPWAYRLHKHTGHGQTHRVTVYTFAQEG